MQLKQINRILVQFSPYTGNARSAREFITRITSRKAQESNADCKIETRVRVKGEPFVEIEYENKQVARIDTGELTIQQILEQKLKAAGFGAGDKLESAWQQHFGKETDSVGQVQFIPRQT
ncbi:hypothetical protein COHA_006552 [Chlorella ohadii]|uniref:Large ribosomal subunit protein mL53 n=1 Tax=Chlorella ohadii TaxID=2649997 RepID=A0AAD5H3S0_9CHLO|nr:hypothetical protein COHA_006552 [Chlorella ohadii]